MPPAPTWPPKLVRKQGTTISRTWNNGRWWNCGKWDPVANRPTPEAIARHLEYVSVWASDRGADPRSRPLAVEVLADWLASPDGPVNVKDRAWIPKVIARLEEWKPALVAESLTAAVFEAWQGKMCDLDYNRTSVKKLVSFVRRSFKWAARQGKYGVSFGQVFELGTVPPPKPSKVREATVVQPVSEADWLAACEESHPQLRAILELLWLTGARPKELLSLRTGPPPRGKAELRYGYLQRSGVLDVRKVKPIVIGPPMAVPVWAAHVRSKVSRKGHVRCLVFGPRSQSALEPLLVGLNPGEFVFSPRRVHGKRSARNGERYTTQAVGNLVKDACDRAGVTPFGVYSIRHRTSERVAAEMGREAEQSYLGHGETITEDYAGFNSTKAAEVARQMG